PSALQLVIGDLQPYLHFFCDPSEILFRLRDFSVALVQSRASSPAVEKVVGKLDTEGAEVARQKGNVALVTVPGKSRDVWHVFGLTQPHPGGGFPQTFSRCAR